MLNLDKDILIQNIKQLMKDNNLTQPKLADDLNVGQPSISKCLSGKQSISIDLVYSIAQYFKVSIDELCTAKEPQKENDNEFPTPPEPIDQFSEICSGLATVFKYASLITTDVQHSETVYAEIIENGHETGEYYRKKGIFGTDNPTNKYIALFFSNYFEPCVKFANQEEADEYYSEIRYCGNLIERNVKINKFLKQLTDLHTIYTNGSMTQESYFHSIESNLAKINEL